MPTHPASPSYQYFVGVDIAAKTFTASWTDSALQPRKPATFTQSLAGYQQLQERLAADGVTPTTTVVVLEATSSYWVSLAVALHEAGYHVAVVNPANVHNYAKSLPRRAKTDTLDAILLTQFAVERRPSPWTPPPQVYHELRQRLTARDALVAMHTQAKNHLHALLQWPVVVETVRERMEEVVSDLDEQIRTLNKEIATILKEDAWATSAALLTSIKGISTLTAAWLLVGTVNFTICPNADAATCYAGLAPLDHDSGTSVHRQKVIGNGGSGRMRRALYMAALSAVRFNAPVKVLYDRLIAAGKPPKVALCAAARKILHIAWAVVTKGKPFDPAYQPPARQQARAA